MSISAINAVMKMEALHATEKWMLVCLAAHLPEKNFKRGKPLIVWPSHDELARKTGMKKRSVINVIDRLIAFGIVEIEQKGGGRGRKNIYKLNIVNSVSDALINNKKSEPDTPNNDINSAIGTPFNNKKGAPDTRKGALDTRKGEPVATTPINQDKVNQPVTKEKPSDVKLPDWLNVEAWNEFIQHRQEIKKRLTPLAAAKNIAVLEKHKTQQQEIINATIANRWTGLFPPKGANSETNQHDNPSRARRVADRLDEIARQDIADRGGFPESLG